MLPERFKSTQAPGGPPFEALLCVGVATGLKAGGLGARACVALPRLAPKAYGLRGVGWQGAGLRDALVQPGGSLTRSYEK